VDDLPGAGPDLDRLHPLVLLEARGDEEVPVGDRALGGDALLPGDGPGGVGRADAPALREPGRGRRVLRVAFRRAGVDPRGDRGDLLARQVAVVLPRADLRVRVPGRHAALDDDLLDLLGGRLRLLVLEEREGADVPGPVALDAALLEDRLDVLVVRDLAGRGGARGRRPPGDLFDRAARRLRGGR